MWGRAVWTFLHVMAQNVDERRFRAETRLREDVRALLELVCSNLPCPDCRQHAAKHLASVQWGAVGTRWDLQLMLFFFHNKVSQRTGNRLFPMEALGGTYVSASMRATAAECAAQLGRPVSDMSYAQDNQRRAHAAMMLLQWVDAHLQDGSLAESALSVN